MSFPSSDPGRTVRSRRRKTAPGLVDPEGEDCGLGGRRIFATREGLVGLTTANGHASAGRDSLTTEWFRHSRRVDPICGFTYGSFEKTKECCIPMWPRHCAISTLDNRHYSGYNGVMKSARYRTSVTVSRAICAAFAGERRSIVLPRDTPVARLEPVANILMKVCRPATSRP